MKLLLIEPYSHNYPIGSGEFDPIGLCYIASAAEKNGHEVKLIHQLSPDFIPNERIVEEAVAFQPQAVGISTMAESFSNGLLLASMIREASDNTIIFGGAHASTFPEIVKEDTIDLAVIGEGEVTVLEILRALEEGGGDFKDIDGIAYYDEGLKINRPRERIKDLDSLPLPYRDGLPINKYKYYLNFYPPPSRQRCLSINTSRGCLHNCSFCIAPGLWRGWIPRDTNGVVDEIEFLIKDYDINLLYICDDCFSTGKSRAHEICSEIIRRNVRIRWCCNARVSDLDRNTLSLMERAGCSQMVLGVESSEETTLNRTDKGTSITQIIDIFEILKSLKITSIASTIMGFPWDTRDSIIKNYKFLKSLNADFLIINCLTPFYGTRVYEYAKKHDLIVVEDLDRYLLNTPIMRTHHLDYNQVSRLQNRLIFRQYFSIKFILHSLMNIIRDSRLLRGYLELLQILLLRKIRMLRRNRELSRLQ